MRKSLLFVWACMGLVCLVSACKTSVKSKEWKLVWVENFDQKNSFDESVWTKIPRGTSDWNNYMSYYDSCYAMQDGNLILRGIANHTQKNDTAPYLTGGVYTKGKKLFTGGRVEIRAKLQAAKGAWPAIWMLPEKAEWPKGGRRPLKAADGAACSAHLTEVHPHSTAEFRDLCEVVQRAVDAVQTVRHSVHKAA